VSCVHAFFGFFLLPINFTQSCCSLQSPLSLFSAKCVHLGQNAECVRLGQKKMMPNQNGLSYAPLCIEATVLRC
jgi:hypothetical protein